MKNIYFLNYHCAFMLINYRMYTNGLNPKIKELYPKITFPVSRGTPSFSDLPLWEHSEKLKSEFVSINFIV